MRRRGDYLQFYLEKEGSMSIEFSNRCFSSPRFTKQAIFLRKVAVILVVGMFFLVSATSAANRNWSTTSGDWSIASNWGGTVPTSGETTYISNGGTVNISLTGEKCGLFYVGNAAGESGFVNQTAGNLSSSSSEYIGFSGVGCYVQSGGTNYMTNHIYMGYNTGSSGNYSLSGKSKLDTYDEYLGYSGAGTFTQTGGTNRVYGVFYLGYNSGSSGTYSLGGDGLLTMHFWEYVGYYGTGTINQTGGTNLSSEQLYLGYYSGSTGNYTLSGTGKLNSYAEYVGYSGVGAFTQTGGSNSLYSLYLGYQSGSTGNYTLSGEGVLTISSGGNLRVGADSGIGRFYLLGGTLSAPTVTLGSKGTLAVGFDFDMNSLVDGTLLNGATLVGLSAGALEITNGATATQTGTTSASVGSLVLGTASGTGSYTLEETSNLSITADAQIGYSGKGTFTQTGGTNTISNTLRLGCNTGATGIYTLSDSGVLFAIAEDIGAGSVGTFNQTGGSNSTHNFSLGVVSGSNGIYNLSGTGHLSVTSLIERIGFGGNGVFNQTGGIHSASYGLALGMRVGSTGTYNLEGGTLILSSLSKGSGTAQFNFGGGTMQASGSLSTALDMSLTGTGGDAKVDTSTYSVTLSGLLSGVGGLTKLGGGTLTLAAENSYVGNTIVKAGTLNITGGIADTGTSLLDIQGGKATLETTDIVKADLTVKTAVGTTFEIVGGTHQIGTLTGTGNTTVDTGSVLAIVNAVTMSGGIISVQDGAGIIFGELLEKNRSYTVSGGNSLTVSDDLDGVQGLEKYGMGRLILSGNNTYTGETTVYEGVLQVTGAPSPDSKISVADAASIVFGVPYSVDSSPEYNSAVLANEIASVPEPATLVLLAASLFSVLVLARRKK